MDVCLTNDSRYLQGQQGTVQICYRSWIFWISASNVSWFSVELIGISSSQGGITDPLEIILAILMSAALEGGTRFPMSERKSKVEFLESPFAENSHHQQWPYSIVVYQWLLNWGGTREEWQYPRYERVLLASNDLARAESVESLIWLFCKLKGIKSCKERVRTWDERAFSS